MNYEETIAYLYEQLPVFQRIGAAAYRKDIRNTQRLAAVCAHPEEGFKSIHIAGTNGKGSTAHGLASVFQACGYRTGLMTSPHYKDFRERIRINGQMIDKDFVVDWVAKNRKDFEAIKPSFFELTVIMGFCYFREQEVDIAIVETGMGGRLDSTNILSPELSIITPIGLDHSAFLGEDIQAIAREKAGIIKKGTPVVIASGNEAVIEVLEAKAREMKAPFHKSVLSEYPIHTDLRGNYQQHNMSTVVRAVDVMRDQGWTLRASQVTEGLGNIASNTGMVGRWQLLGTKPHMIADSAHNPPGIAAAMDNLKDELYSELHVIIGMVSDKDIDAVLSLLPLKATYYFCQAKVMRAISCDELAQKGKRLGLIGECYGSVAAALTAAKEAAEKEDLILVTGSVFVVGEVV